MRGAAIAWIAGTIIVGAVGLGCASKQRIPLDCVPPAASVYVDGEKLEKVPSELKLTTDRPHTVYIKGEGIMPELVVLTTEEVEGKMKLSPSVVCSPPRAVEAQRKLSVEIDPDAPGDPPASDEDLGSTIDLEPRPDFTPGGL